MSWLDGLDEDRTFISVISIAELQRGVKGMVEGPRRAALAEWLEFDLPERFAGRILPVDRPVAELWGTLMARARTSGIGLSAMDAFFAATALSANLVLATRNIKDFRSLDMPLFDPWAATNQSR